MPNAVNSCVRRSNTLTASSCCWNTTFHMRSSAEDQMNVKQWEVLKHSAYTPHLLPCNFCIFGQPKKALKGSTFTARDDTQETAV
jgi:hypothetical protein